MKKISILTAAIVVFAFFVNYKNIRAKEPSNYQKNYVQNEVLVKFKDNKLNLKKFSEETKAEKLVGEKNLKIKRKLEQANTLLLKTENGDSVESTIKKLEKDPSVEYAEPNYINRLASINTNDTFKDYLWALDNSGATINGKSGVNDADVDLPEAWQITEGGENIVAVIDNGVFYSHSDFSSDNFWNGSQCKDVNGNYLGNCIYGYDFISNDKNPLPQNAGDHHGTLVSSLIASTKNNNRGILGVAPRSKIMILKNFEKDYITSDSFVNGVDFARINGAKIINFSASGPNFTQSALDAIKRFRDAGGIFVTAAGNDGNDIDQNYHSYPCQYDLENIICVAATNQNDDLVSMGAGNFWGSDYGSMSVDLGAPGDNILAATSSSENLSMAETFEGVSSPNIPASLTGSGDWGTILIDDGDKFGNVLGPDQGGPPYSNDDNSTVTSSTFNLSDSSIESVKMDFWAVCDTEYTTEEWYDYAALEVSSDGINFYELPYLDQRQAGSKFDEYLLQLMNDNVTDGGESGQASVYSFNDVPIPEEYFTSNFKFRFHWVTDSSGNDYFGCAVDNIKLKKYITAGENYIYEGGTSLSSPIVAGAVSLVWGYRPSQSASMVKSIILNSGDLKASLQGKTVTGRRLNIKNALNSVDVTPPVISGVSSGGRYSSNLNITFNEGSGSLDGNAFSSGSVVTSEGSHSLIVTDSSGNSTTLSFTIDKTSPTVSGVTNGVTYNSNVTPSFSEGSATLNGASFSSGTEITRDGNYSLILKDDLDNSNEINFIVDKIATNSPYLNYTRKKATKKINIVLYGISLDKKKNNVSARIGNKKVKVAGVRNLDGRALVTLTVSYGKWSRGSYGLNLSYKKKNNKKWVRGNISTDNILTIR